MARVFKPAQFSLLPQAGVAADPWMQEPLQSGHCFASNGDEFSGGTPPKAPEKGEAGRSITAREAPTPVAWSNRAELHELFEKIPIGQRFSFLCRNIEALTHDDVAELSPQFFSDTGNDVESSERVLVMALGDVLKKKEVTWQSLPDDIIAEFNSRNMVAPLLEALRDVAPNFDSKLSWNLLDIALGCLSASDHVLRWDATNLLVKFEANLSGAEARIAREGLMKTLEREKDSQVCTNMICALGIMGSRDDHSDHEKLADVVAEYLADDDEHVRIATIQALIKIVPNIDEGGNIESLQNILRDRTKVEKNPLVREWLRTAIAQLDNQLRDVAQETPADVDAGQLPVAWSSREELLAIVEKIPVGQRFAFFCRNIEGLTSDDIQSCMKMYPRDLDGMSCAEHNLVSALRQSLESNGKLECRSLPGAVIEAYRNMYMLLKELQLVAPHFDSGLTWNLFPIAMRGLGNSDPEIRNKAAELATIFEANLSGVQARMAREELVQALGREEDPKVRGDMIYSLGEMGARDSHSEHERIAGWVAKYVDDPDIQVRDEVIDALIKIAPHLEKYDLLIKAAKRLDAFSIGGRVNPPQPMERRLWAIDRLQALSGRSSAFDNSIAGSLETFWRDVEPEVRGAALDAWSEVISNLEPEHALERSGILLCEIGSSDIFYEMYLRGIGHLIPRLDIETRLSTIRDIQEVAINGSGEYSLLHGVAAIADNLDNLRPVDQSGVAQDMVPLVTQLKFWDFTDDPQGRETQDTLVRTFENIGRHLGIADLNDFIDRVSRRGGDPRILAALNGLPQRRHYEAAFIRAAVRRAGVGRVSEDGNGYLNRGIHKGNRETRGGPDFRDLREVRPGEPVGRIDIAATARTGKVHERVFHQEQSRPVMIAVDPRVFQEVKPDERERIICKIGTIAQMAIARRDPVGLVIGNGQAYLKPGYDSARLVNILKALGNHKNEGSPAEIEEMLEHRTVRKNAPHGAEIVVVSKFDRRNQDLKGLAKICARFKARNVCVTPVKIEGAITYASPQVEIGGMKFVPPQDVLDRLAKDMAARRAEEMQVFLKETGGRYVSENGDDIKAAVADAIVDLARPELPDVVPDQVSIRSETVSIDGSVVGVHESVVATIMRMAIEGHPDVLDSARYYGIGKLYENIRIALDRSFGYEPGVLKQADIDRVERLKKSFYEDYEPISGFGGFGNPGLPLAQWAGQELPLEDAFAFGPGRKFWKKFCELYKYLRKKYGTPVSKDAPIGERLWVGLTDRLGLGRRDKLFEDSDSAQKDAADDGTPKEQADDAIWQRVWGLRGITRKHYLRDSVGIVYDSAHARYLHHAEFSNRSMHIEGGKRVVGKILDSIPGGEFKLPVPVNGVVDHVDVTEGGRVQARVHYRVRTKMPGEVEKLKAMNLSAFRREAVSLYGARLYADMTDAVPLDEVPEPMRSEWQTLLPLLDRVSVGTAMCIIQGYFILYRQKLYEESADRQEKEKRFAEFRERAARGEARGKDEYLSHAVELGGGIFVETSRIAVALMRMAGIPTALSSGFVVGAFGAVSGKSARVWPEVFFPLGGDEWHGEPIELSEAHPLESTMRLVRNAFDEAMSPSGFSLEARVASLSEGDLADEAIDVHADENPEPETTVEAVMEEPVDEQPEVGVSQPPRRYPERAEPLPIGALLAQLPTLWHRMNEDERARLSNAISMIPVLTQYVGQVWEGSDELINEILLNNWQDVVRHGFYGRTVPLDKARRIIADSIDAARDNDRLRVDLERWVRVARQLLR